jgi:hypothetical protein
LLLLQLVPGKIRYLIDILSYTLPITLQSYGIGPGTFRFLCIDNIIRSVSGKVNVKESVHIDQIRCPNISDISLESMAKGGPVGQIAGLPYEKPRSIHERRVCHVIILTYPDYGRIGIIAP